MRLNVYSVDFHTRAKATEDHTPPPGPSQHELVVASSQDDVATILRREFKELNIEIEHIGNGPHNVIFDVPRSLPPRPVAPKAGKGASAAPAAPIVPFKET